MLDLPVLENVFFFPFVIASVISDCVSRLFWQFVQCTFISTENDFITVFFLNFFLVGVLVFSSDASFNR